MSRWNGQADGPAPERARIPLWGAAPVILPAGPLRGKRWLPFSGGKVLRLAFGRYEPKQTALLQREIGPGDVFFDVGAAAGYYTLLAAALVGPAGRVVAFEPDPQNAAYLRRHVRINRLHNVVVMEAAAAESSGLRAFLPGRGTGTGRLAPQGRLAVAACTLDDAVQQTQLTPTHVKIDVEGAEERVLRGAERLLRLARPVLFLSVHSKQLRAACQARLRQSGYFVAPINATRVEEATELHCRPEPRARGAPARPALRQAS